MSRYVLLLRGINVGGKNKIAMSDLRSCLEKLQFTDVSTYIASGNAFVTSHKSAQAVQSLVEAALSQDFKLDSEIVKVLALSQAQLQSTVDRKPTGFGEQSQTYHSDVIFLIDVSVTKAMQVFSPREGVDTVWPGDGVIYSQRVSAERTKSRLGKIVGTPVYKSMTIRNWNTTVKMLELLKS